MNKEEIINKKYLTDSGLAIDLMEGKLDIDNPLIRNAVTQIGAYDEIYNQSSRVIVRYNFTDNTMLGQKILYDTIDAIYVDGEMFDIKNLVVESNIVSLPTGYTGEHVVEFDLGSAIFRESAMLGSANYTIVEVPEKNNPITHANGYEFVDLGLPSGTLWATKNIGANTPTEPGLYSRGLVQPDIKTLLNTNLILVKVIHHISIMLKYINIKPKTTPTLEFTMISSN